MKNIRVVFMGTPEFAVPALRGLAAAFNVVMVVTQPDRPRGRGLLSAPTPVKKAAEELGLNVIQPVKLKDAAFTANLAALEPDFIVTSAYGRILSPEILAVPVIAALNIHASLLPRYRGAAPIHRTVINGDSMSGITIMYMDEGMDTGDILVQRSVPISRDMTSGELHDILALLGADMIVPAITSIVSGSADRVKQDDALATNALPLAPGEEEIDWCASAVSVHNLVRGMNPWPGAYTLLNGKRMKIWSGRPEETGCHHPGTVLDACDSGILVAAGSGAYRITRLQPPGKRVMSAAEYLCGNLLVTAGTPGRGEHDGSP